MCSTVLQFHSLRGQPLGEIQIGGKPPRRFYRNIPATTRHFPRGQKQLKTLTSRKSSFTLKHWRIFNILNDVLQNRLEHFFATLQLSQFLILKHDPRVYFVKALLMMLGSLDLLVLRIYTVTPSFPTVS